MSDQPLHRWRIWAIAGGLVAFASGIVTIAAYLWPPKPPLPPPPVIHLDTAKLGNLGIIDASLQTQTHPRNVLGFIPAGTDNFYLYDINFRNSDGVRRQDCYVSTEFSGPETRGHAVLWRGSWSDWYGKSGSMFFDLPATPSYQERFFTDPDPKKMRRLGRVRARLVCNKPSREVSQWYNVDLTGAEWP